MQVEKATVYLWIENTHLRKQFELFWIARQNVDEFAANLSDRSRKTRTLGMRIYLIEIDFLRRNMMFSTQHFSFPETALVNFHLVQWTNVPTNR